MQLLLSKKVGIIKHMHKLINIEAVKQYIDKHRQINETNEQIIESIRNTLLNEVVICINSTIPQILQEQNY